MVVEMVVVVPEEPIDCEPGFTPARIYPATQTSVLGINPIPVPNLENFSDNLSVYDFGEDWANRGRITFNLNDSKLLNNDQVRLLHLSDPKDQNSYSTTTQLQNEGMVTTTLRARYILVGTLEKIRTADLSPYLPNGMQLCMKVTAAGSNEEIPQTNVGDGGDDGGGDGTPSPSPSPSGGIPIGDRVTWTGDQPDINCDIYNPGDLRGQVVSGAMYAAEKTGGDRITLVPDFSHYNNTGGTFKVKKGETYLIEYLNPTTDIRLLFSQTSRINNFTKDYVDYDTIIYADQPSAEVKAKGDYIVVTEDNYNIGEENAVRRRDWEPNGSPICLSFSKQNAPDTDTGVESCPYTYRSEKLYGRGDTHQPLDYAPDILHEVPDWNSIDNIFPVGLTKFGRPELLTSGIKYRITLHKDAYYNVRLLWTSSEPTTPSFQYLDTNTILRPGETKEMVSPSSYCYLVDMDAPKDVSQNWVDGYNICMRFDDGTGDDEFEDTEDFNKDCSSRNGILGYALYDDKTQNYPIFGVNSHFLPDDPDDIDSWVGSSAARITKPIHKGFNGCEY